MEIIIKTKQKFNPSFSFLNYNDPLFPYYRHLKEMILTGGYRPVPRLDSSNGIGRDDDFGLVGQTEDSGRTREIPDSRLVTVTKGSVGGSGGTKNSSTTVKDDSAGVDAGSDSDSDSDDSDGGYLHPLLMAKSSKPPTTAAAPPSTESAPPTSGTNWVALNSTATSVASDRDKKLSMEELLGLHSSSSFSAKSMAVNSAPVLSSGLASQGEATSAQETFSNAEALAAYEHYKLQFCGRYGGYIRMHTCDHLTCSVFQLEPTDRCISVYVRVEGAAMIHLV